MRRFSDPEVPTGDGEAGFLAPLAAARKGFSGVIAEVRAPGPSGGLPAEEIERRLVEMGFVEGAPLVVVCEGPVGRDPIAVRLADRTVALRRREAQAVLVRPGTPR